MILTTPKIYQSWNNKSHFKIYVKYCYQKLFFKANVLYSRIQSQSNLGKLLPWRRPLNGKFSADGPSMHLCVKFVTLAVYCGYVRGFLVTYRMGRVWPVNQPIRISWRSHVWLVDKPKSKSLQIGLKFQLLHTYLPSTFKFSDVQIKVSFFKVVNQSTDKILIQKLSKFQINT